MLPFENLIATGKNLTPISEEVCLFNKSFFNFRIFGITVTCIRHMVTEVVFEEVPRFLSLDLSKEYLSSPDQAKATS